MADASDFPFLDDPHRLLGLGAYRLTADEFQVGARAVLATEPWRRSWSWWFAFFGPWHAALAVGVWMLVAWARGVDGPFGPVDGGQAFAACAATFASALVLWLALYGLPWRIRRLYRTFLGAGEEYAFAFTPARWMLHTPMSDSSYDWEFLRDVFEFNDGFLFRLKTAPGGFWLPDHALVAPFGHRAAADLFRSKISKYRVVDRSTGRTPD